jgi:EAL domain-containing protein (putative c-di-GMP-specific phosphodiesterase class I)
VNPHDFVPGLEALGMMGDVSRWLLQTMLPLMRAPGIDPDLQLTLLAPSAQLHCTQMLDMLRQAIDTFGLRPRRLCIEIPVAALPDDNDIASQFDLLRRRGVRLALSDFTDNPACRSALEWLSPDVVTLDARRLGQPAHPDLARTLREACAWARAAGASVCAKGIETRAQMQQVREWGCDTLQGYLLSQSFPARWLPETHPALAQRARDLLT